MPAQPQSFELRGQYITLEAFVKAADLGQAREQSRAVIAQGAVHVNGQIETRRGRKLRPGDLVTMGSEQVRISATATATAPDHPQ
jgi:ribosome-associated protein